MKNIFAQLLLYSCLVMACNDHNEDGHSHDVDANAAAADELPGLSYTLYSKRTELFVEFKPLVVNSETRFATHLTHLFSKFKPYTEGTVTLTLESGGKSQSITSNELTAPGIFRLRMTPQTAGKGRLLFYIKTYTFSDTVIIDDITVFPDKATALKNTPHEEASTDISYLKEQAWKTEFANTQVTPQTFHEVIKTSGQIISSPGDATVISAPANGIVSFTSNATAGTIVKSGQNVFRLSGGNIAEGNVETTYKEAKANFDKAKSDYDRANELVKDKIISQKEYSDIQLRYQNAQSVYSSFSKNYSGSGLNISSPMNGFVTQVFVSDGEFVNAGEPLASVSKNQKLTLRADLTQRYYSKLQHITSANFRTDKSDTVFSIESLEGKLLSYGKNAANSNSIPIMFEIENRGNLIPGSFVEVYLQSTPIENALVIPVSALIEEQGNFYVYVQTGGESFQKREVKLGGNDGKNVQVLSGIDEGERVVTKGAFQMKLATMSGTMPAHGHEH